MYANMHGHARDFNQRYKGETIAHALEVCRYVGIDLFGDMPNTDPPVMTEKDVVDRLNLAREANVPEVRYGLYIGLTSDAEQIRNAVGIVQRLFPDVVGMKLYAGHSVGRLGVIDLEKQAIVYETLAKEGYEGLLSVHAEKEESLKPGLWTPSNPITHCLARPAQAEIDSVRDQLHLAKRYGFKGKLHLAHLSVPESVDLVQKAKQDGRDVSWEVCAHHLIYDFGVMSTETGLWYKVNPPIRDLDSKNGMLEKLRNDPDGILTDDHAPHTRDEKIDPKTNKFMSGIVGLPYWALFEEFLRRNGFTEAQIGRVMFENAVKRLGVNVERRIVKVKDRRGDYAFDFYEGLAKTLGFNWDQNR